jgi:hypothetical protein
VSRKYLSARPRARRRPFPTARYGEEGEAVSRIAEQVGLVTGGVDTYADVQILLIIQQPPEQEYRHPVRASVRIAADRPLSRLHCLDVDSLADAASGRAIEHAYVPRSPHEHTDRRQALLSNWEVCLAAYFTLAIF